MDNQIVLDNGISNKGDFIILPLTPQFLLIGFNKVNQKDYLIINEESYNFLQHLLIENSLFYLYSNKSSRFLNYSDRKVDLDLYLKCKEFRDNIHKNYLNNKI